MSLKSLILAAVYILMGIFLGLFIAKGTSKNATLKPQTESLPSEVRLGGFKYINPLLECESNKPSSGNEFSALEKQLAAFIKDKTQNSKVSQASVYFRDLNNGPWIGVNEKADFSPASLLKLPVMMAYFKKAEADLNLLNKKIKFERQEVGVEPDIKSSQSLELGKTYSVSELIERMIESSDNQALSLLQKNLDNKLIDKVTQDLGIATPTDQTPEDFMSVKEYASLFRVLYNASYLNQALSEKALEILTKVEFKQGIVAGVDPKVIVAHKFGERELDSGIKQLHDCGIVYFPSRPYLICIMTRGKDFNELASTIQSLSKQVYDQISKRN